MTASALLLGKPNGRVRPSPSTSASAGSGALGWVGPPPGIPAGRRRSASRDRFFVMQARRVRLLAAGSWRLLGVGQCLLDPGCWAMRWRAAGSLAGSEVHGVGQGPRQAFLPGVARWLAGLSSMRGNFTQQDKLYATQHIGTHFSHVTHPNSFYALYAS